MIEIFITNIYDEAIALDLNTQLVSQYPLYKINFDLNDIKPVPFPCGHSILRIEGKDIKRTEVVSFITKSGYQCDILEDKICEQIN